MKTIKGQKISTVALKKLSKDKLISAYTDLITDDIGEPIIPNQDGEFFRAIDLCYLVSVGHSIANACEQFKISPIRFMMLRHKFSDLNLMLEAAVELAGELDIQQAEKLLSNADPEEYMPLLREKVKFYVWRGKNRFKSMYGDKLSGVSVQVNNNPTNVQVAEAVRSLSDMSTSKVIEHKDYELKD